MRKTLTLTLTLTLTFLASFLFISCDNDKSDEPEILNNTEWYPERATGVVFKTYFDVPIENNQGIVTYELDGVQRTTTLSFPNYYFFMKGGKNVYSFFYKPEDKGSFPKEYYIDGQYIFLETINVSSAWGAGDKLQNFEPHWWEMTPPNNFRIKSVQGYDIYYKKR